MHHQVRSNRKSWNHSEIKLWLCKITNKLTPTASTIQTNIILRAVQMYLHVHLQAANVNGANNLITCESLPKLHLHLNVKFFYHVFESIISDPRLANEEFSTSSYAGQDSPGSTAWPLHESRCYCRSGHPAGAESWYHFLHHG